MAKIKKRVSFSDINQEITIDEIDKMIMKKNPVKVEEKIDIGIPKIIKHENTIRKNVFMKNVVLGSTLFALSIAIYLYFNGSFNF